VKKLRKFFKADTVGSSSPNGKTGADVRWISPKGYVKKIPNSISQKSFPGDPKTLTRVSAGNYLIVDKQIITSWD